MSRHHLFVISEHERPEGWADASDMPDTFEFLIRTLFMHAYAEPGIALLDPSGFSSLRSTVSPHRPERVD